MLTPTQIQVYRCAGSKAGNARRLGDVSLADGLKRWCSCAIALEQPADRNRCLEAFESAYLEATEVDSRCWVTAGRN
jgi:hypothetical protein